MTKRILALLQICFLLFSIYPHQVRAFAPVAVLGAPQIVTAGGAAYSLSMAGLSALVGLAGLASLIDDGEGNQVRVPLTTDPSSESVMPAPAAASTSSQATGYTYPYTCSSQTSAWAVTCTYDNGTYLTRTYTITSETVDSQGVKTCNYSSEDIRYSGYQPCTIVMSQGAGPSGSFQVPGVSTASCPAGYSLSGSDCVLQNARAAVPDNKRDFAISGTGADAHFQQAADDVDNCTGGYTGGSACQGVDGVIRGDGGTAKSLYVTGKNADGETVLVKYSITADGTKTYVDYYRETNPTGYQTQVVQTRVEQQTSTGTITGVQTLTSPGQITQPSAQSIPSSTSTESSANDTPQVVVQTDASVYPGSNSGTQTIQFPSDYNRESTQQDIRNKLDNSTEVVDPALPQTTEFDDAFFKETFSGLLSWRLPSHSSSCPTGSFSWNSSSYQFDAHCQLIIDHWGILQQAMVVVWSILALFIVLRA